MPPTGGIRTHDLSRSAAADPHLRPRGHWVSHMIVVEYSDWRFIYRSLSTVLFCFIPVIHIGKCHKKEQCFSFKMSSCAFTWCVYTGVWCVLFNTMVRKKCEGWSWEPSGLFWNRRDISLQPVSWKSKVSMGGYGLCSGGFRNRSFSRTLYGCWLQDDHHWGRVSVQFKYEECSCDHCRACNHRFARLAAGWY